MFGKQRNSLKNILKRWKINRHKQHCPPKKNGDKYIWVIQYINPPNHSTQAANREDIKQGIDREPNKDDCSCENNITGRAPEV